MKRVLVVCASVATLLLHCTTLQANPVTDRIAKEDALFNSGVAAMQAGQYAVAETRFTALLDLQDAPPPKGMVDVTDVTDMLDNDAQALVRGHTFRGIARYYLAKHDGSLADFNAVTSYCHEHKDDDACYSHLKAAVYYRGMLLIDMNNMVAAGNDFTWVLENTTFHRNAALLGRAVTYIYRDKPHKAMADIRVVLSRVPNHIDAYGELCMAQADAYLLTGDAKYLTAAVKSHKTAISLDKGKQYAYTSDCERWLAEAIKESRNKK